MGQLVSRLNLLQFYTTTPYECSYLAGEKARSLVATPQRMIDHEIFSDLVGLGFRRSGLFTYRPNCDQCKACIPVRVDVSAFQPNRSQARNLKKNQHLTSKLLPLMFSEEHYQLYQKYQHARHAGGGMDQDNLEQYRQFFLESRADSALIEFRHQSEGRATDSSLVMVALVDRVRDGLSAVYTFFDPDLKTGLGTYGILWQIQHARQLGLNYLYLGYWIEQCPKMNYKNQFRPVEMRVDEVWIPMPNQP